VKTPKNPGKIRFLLPIPPLRDKLPFRSPRRLGRSVGQALIAQCCVSGSFLRRTRTENAYAFDQASRGSMPAGVSSKGDKFFNGNNLTR
jgi:hypothetical protein